MIRLVRLGLFSVIKTSISEVSKIVIEALASSICLKRVNLEASGTLSKPQNSLNSFEYLRNIIKSLSVGIEKI